MSTTELDDLRIELHRLAGLLGADDSALDQCLTDIDQAGSSWALLESACAACGPVLRDAPARGLLTPVLQGLLQERPDAKVVKTEAEWDTQTGALCIAMYPPTAHAALKQKHWWGRLGPDVFGLFDDGEQTVAFYAAMDEWRVLADNPLTLLRNEVDRVTDAALDASGPMRRAPRPTS